MPHPNIPDGVILRSSRQSSQNSQTQFSRPMPGVAAPMTRFYTEPRVPETHPASHPTPSDFPPPPPFIFQLKDLSRQVQSHQSQQGTQQPTNQRQGFELPPPPPELMVQAARTFKVLKIFENQDLDKLKQI